MRSSPVLVFLLGLVAGAVTLAQEPQAPTGGQALFRGGVTLVTTDVIARDSQGRFVSDLTRDDFRVVEDGEPQAVASFVMVHGGRVFNLVNPPPPNVPEGIVLPPARRPSTADDSGRVILIFVDDLHFEAVYTPHVRRLVQQITETLLHEGDLVAMVSSGPSGIEIQPTLDHKLVASAANQIRGSQATVEEMFQMLESSQGPGDLRYRTQIACQTAYNMVASLDQVQNRRKAVIYISTGYDFDPFAEARRAQDHVMGGRYSDWTRFLFDEDNPYYKMNSVTADVDLYAFMKELTLAANRTNTSFFTIDPRGLVGITDAGQYLDQSEWRTYIQKAQSTLRYLAEETGGIAVVNTNDFEGALKQIDAETSDYYVIGYYPTNADPKRRTRKLEVTVTRPGLTVLSRREYSLKAAGRVPVAALPSDKTKKKR